MAQRSTKSPRKRYIVVASLLVLVIQAFAVLVSGVWASNNSITVASQAIEREGDATVQSILRHLDPAEQSIEVTTRLFENDLIDSSAPALEKYLHAQLDVMPQATGAFIGYPDSSFVFVSVDGDGFRSKRITVDGGRRVEVRQYDAAFRVHSSEIVSDDAYDPTTRPWYVLAERSELLAWTDPYVFFSSGQPGVTASSAVRSNGEIVAVVGVDVELSGLSSLLDDLAVSESGEAFVVSGNNVVAAPSSYESSTGVTPDGGVRLLATDELGVAALAAGVNAQIQRVESGDGHDLVWRQRFPADQGLRWSVVVRSPESSFTNVIVQQQRLTLVITIGGAVLVLLAFLILWRISRPINSLHELASTDPLTGLANRRLISSVGAQLIDELGDGEFLAVTVIDLDSFKSLNDTHGHDRGDRALVTVAAQLRLLIRDGDLVGRLGGDEFVVAQPVASIGDGVHTAQKLHDDLAAGLRLEMPTTDIGITSGLAIGDGSGDFAALLRQADVALIGAKDGNKGTLRATEALVATSA